MTQVRETRALAWLALTSGLLSIPSSIVWPICMVFALAALALGAVAIVQGRGSLIALAAWGLALVGVVLAIAYVPWAWSQV